MIAAGKIFSCIVFSLLLIVSTTSAQENLGVFTTHNDVGTAVKPGFSVFIPQTGQYIITGAGANVWAGEDEFQFCWKKMSGDFILSAKAEFLGSWVDFHRKVGWMIRKSLDGNSAHVNAVEHGDGLTSLQFRRTTGAQTEEHKLKMTKANILQLERKGNLYIMRAAVDGQAFLADTISNIALGDEVYVGLFVCSHNKDVLETGVFSNVKISLPVKGAYSQIGEVMHDNYFNLPATSINSVNNTTAYQTEKNKITATWVKIRHYSTGGGF